MSELTLHKRETANENTVNEKKQKIFHHVCRMCMRRCATWGRRGGRIGGVAQGGAGLWQGPTLGGNSAHSNLFSELSKLTQKNKITVFWHFDILWRSNR